MKDAISQWIDNNQELTIQRLQELVQLKSTQGKEKAVQQKVADLIKTLNFSVHMWDLDGERLKKHPYFYSNRQDFTNSPNVVGVLKGTGDGQSIILNGHVDVVPEGDYEQWTDDPYSGKIKGGKLYG